MRTFALIPAAGLSRRMGRPKLALPLGNNTVLERVIATVREGGVPDVVVVVDFSNRDLQRLAENAGARTLVLENQTPDMRSTVQAGLSFLRRTFGDREFQNWMLLPADHPTIEPGVVRLLCDVGTDLGHSIFVPEHGNKRGHPTLFRWHHAARLQRWPIDQGINQYIRAHAEETYEVYWPSDEILIDLDTPEDYERLVKREASRRTANGG